MHIFVADEFPLAVFANTCRRALQVPPSLGCHHIAYGREKRGSAERAQMAAVLPFLEGPDLSRSTDESLAIISDGGAGFDGFGSRCGRQVTSLTLRGERPCDHVSPF
jgi:hypothetical protein